MPVDDFTTRERDFMRLVWTQAYVAEFQRLFSAALVSGRPGMGEPRKWGEYAAQFADLTVKYLPPP